MTDSSPTVDFTVADIATYGSTATKQLRVSHIEGTKDCFLQLIDGKKCVAPSNTFALGCLVENVILQTKVSCFWTFIKDHDKTSSADLKSAYTRELRKVYHGHNRSFKKALEPYLKHFNEFDECQDYE